MSNTLIIQKSTRVVNDSDNTLVMVNLAWLIGKVIQSELLLDDMDIGVNMSDEQYLNIEDNLVFSSISDLEIRNLTDTLEIQHVNG